MKNKIKFSLLLIIIGFVSLTNTAYAVTITEFPVPASNVYGSIYGISSGHDDNLWFTESYVNKIGRITPSGIFTEFSVGITPSSYPFGITAGPDGNIWFTGGPNQIGRITPSGNVTEFSVGITPNSYPRRITAGPDGNIWFTSGPARIGKITPSGSVTEFPTEIRFNGNAIGITSGPDGNLWFTKGPNWIGRITPSGTITEFSTGITPNSFPNLITTGSDGNLWFTEASVDGNRIGKITSAGVVTEFPIPTSNSNPQDITLGPDGNIWFTEYDGNKIGKITPAGVITEFPIPNSVSNPRAITLGPDGNLWFSGSSGSLGKIGRLSFDEVEFSAANYSVNENAETITITVNRIGDAIGPAQVDYSTSDGSAGPESYISKTGTLVFANAEMSKTFTVTINNNTFPQPDRIFNLTLSNPADGTILGDQRTTTVEIIDDDVPSNGAGISNGIGNNDDAAGTSRGGSGGCSVAHSLAFDFKNVIVFYMLGLAFVGILTIRLNKMVKDLQGCQ